MSDAQFLGMLVIALGSLATLFCAVYKPLSENTKAMTELTLKIGFLAQKIEEQEKKQEKHEKEFEDYKEHVSQSQKRQWDEISKQNEMLSRHDTEIKNLKGD